MSRLARCLCGKTVPSDPRLPFFEDRGPGSRAATEKCRCGHTIEAHVHPHPVTQNGLCTGFVSRGPAETDSFYCGCMGWD